MAGTPQPAQFGNPNLHFAALAALGACGAAHRRATGARRAGSAPASATVLAVGPRSLTTIAANEPRPARSQGPISAAPDFSSRLALVARMPSSPPAADNRLEVAKKPNGTAVAAL